MADLLGVAGSGESAAGAPESAEVDPGPESPLEPQEPLSADVSAQGTPFSARPIHPYWRGESVTESALRELHLWPRTKPAPAAVTAAAAAWPPVLAQSKAAFKAEGELASAKVMVAHLAGYYAELPKGGHPPIEMLRQDWPDLPPADADRVRYDTAVLMIAKIEHALGKAWARGGAWQAAVDQAGREHRA